MMFMLGNSRRTIRLFVRAALVVMVLPAAAHAETRYRGDLDSLTRTKDSFFDEFYLQRNIDLSAYDKVLIRPVGVIYGQDRDFKKYSKRDLQGRQAYLHDALAKQFSKTHSLVDKAGPGVLVISASLTNLRNNKPTHDQLSKNMDLSWSGSFQAGAAGFQAAIKDGETGALVAAVADRRAVPDLEFNIQNRFTTWGDANDFMDRWAQILPQRLE